MTTMINQIQQYKDIIQEIIVPILQIRPYWHPIAQNEWYGIDGPRIHFQIVEINNFKAITDSSNSSDKVYQAHMIIKCVVKNYNAFEETIKLSVKLNDIGIQEEFKQNNLEIINITNIKNILTTDDEDVIEDKNVKDEESKIFSLNITFKIKLIDHVKE